jgi:type II secretory pathway component PulM
MIIHVVWLQVVYQRSGVKVTATPVDHYKTGGPVAYRLDWQGLSMTYSGGARCSRQY